MQLEQLIGAEFQGEYRAELGSFLGPGSDLELARWVDATVNGALGRRVEQALFAHKSAGAVFGLVLDGGERVVLKLFWPRLSHAELLAIHRIHALVVARGFPAPSARAPVFQTDRRGLYAAIYDCADGELVDPHEPPVRAQLAQRLAELSGLLRDADPGGLPPSPAIGPALYWPSHRAFIDLERPRVDAAFIDDRARAAQAIVRAAGLPVQPAHLDWTIANMRFQAGKLAAVLDWDALSAASEPDLVGRAAALFTAQWDLPVQLSPARDEARAFVAEYERARGHAFTAAERVVLAASADYAIAQVARLQQAAGETRPDSYVELLRACADEPLL